MTKADQIPAPVYIMFLDFSHSPGEAIVTGINTAKIIDRIISATTNNWTTIFINLIIET